ncbi:DUF2332 domain-containing protein [Litoreibacter janthinus]|uniref:DUF2332 domain-containing protein n=1 Tax=Litoreibacter janthinus TaxID=670154 RepID=A0A1I6GA02_9RHOB|nr:DUF2332 family protein [Litoreibacter janthinus]SFR38897.1 hypothetical protein SAMN04488002_1111 [Litoreibacter janthinus]
MSLKDALRDQAGHCAALGSPFMARLLTLLANRLRPDTPLTERLFNWPGDLSPHGASVPLRLAGALHAHVLRAPDSALARAYPPAEVSDDALWAAVLRTLVDEAEFLDAFLDSPPQTNEVRRSAAILPAAMVAAEHFGLPLTVSELGASAGLNLTFDRYALQINGLTYGAKNPVLTLTPDWTGRPPPTAQLSVMDRCGVDLNPLTAPEDAARLRAYLWADQPERLTLTNAALSLPRPRIDRADAADWLEARLSHTLSGSTHFLFHTIAWQYFPDAVQARCTRAIEAAADRATPDAPLAWFAMESDNGAGGQGAKLTLRLWPGSLVLELGRADFHGRWVNWS